MSITVSLMSKKEGSLKVFLDKYYAKETEVDNHVIEWIYVYRDPLKALDITEVALDNREDYNMSVWVQIEDEDIVEVTRKNRTKVINRIADQINHSGKVNCNTSV